MLTRLRLKREFRLFVRCLSESPPENDIKKSEKQTKDNKQAKEKVDSNIDKIQALLKSMTAEPKITDTEYREKFTTAPERPLKAYSDDTEVKTEKIEEGITKAASEVAQVIGGNIKQTEAELLSKVLGKINQTSTSLSDLIVGMKVDRSKETDEQKPKETRGQQVKRMIYKSKTEAQTQQGQYRPKPQIGEPAVTKRSLPQPTKINIFSGEPLGIFETKEVNNGTKLDVWETLERRELMLATLQPPGNYFQKMILWTDQGKVWKFPINNEQGIEDENNVHFSEHIFLDAHLEGWCPKKGPIRHFMELVCTGLSKNAFYTVKEKRDHIMWYKEYFESKKDLLIEVGAWEIQPSNSESTTST